MSMHDAIQAKRASYERVETERLERDKKAKPEYLVRDRDVVDKEERDMIAKHRKPLDGGRDCHAIRHLA